MKQHRFIFGWYFGLIIFMACSISTLICMKTNALTMGDVVLWIFLAMYFVLFCITPPFWIFLGLPDEYKKKKSQIIKNIIFPNKNANIELEFRAGYYVLVFFWFIFFGSIAIGFIGSSSFPFFPTLISIIQMFAVGIIWFVSGLKYKRDFYW